MRTISTFLIVIVLSSLRGDDFASCKEATLSKMASIAGWCTDEKGLVMMDIIKEKQCKVCVEIGVLSGKSLFPIAKALQHNGKGKVFAVDAWDRAESVKGFEEKDPNYAWWNSLDYEYFYQATLNLIKENHLNKYCKVIRQPSKDAVYAFANHSIDFIHFDGNHNGQHAFDDVLAYYPKIKDKGIIILNDANWFGMMQSLVFLLERADLLSSFSRNSPYFIFQKNDERMHTTNTLLE